VAPGQRVVRYLQCVGVGVNSALQRGEGVTRDRAVAGFPVGLARFKGGVVPRVVATGIPVYPVPFFIVDLPWGLQGYMVIALQCSVVLSEATSEGSGKDCLV